MPPSLRLCHVDAYWAASDELTLPGPFSAAQ